MAHITGITYFVQIEATDIDNMTECVMSFRPLVDRMIIIQNNEGRVRESIRKLADVYVVNNVNKLMAGAVNEGYSIASAFRDTEYLLFIDDGIRARGLDVQSLCTDGLASPRIGTQEARLRAHASCFMVHKDNFQKVGLWDTRAGNAADQAWFEKAISLGMPTYQLPHVVEHKHVRNDTNRVEYFNIKTEAL